MVKIDALPFGGRVFSFWGQNIRHRGTEVAEKNQLSVFSVVLCVSVANIPVKP